MQQVVKSDSRNKAVLDQYGIPYAEVDGGYIVDFSEIEEDDPHFRRFRLDTDGNFFFTYAPYAGLLVPFQKETMSGLKLGDLVQRKERTRGQPLMIDSISPPDAVRGLPWEWVGVRGPIGSYGFYAHELEPFDVVKNLHEGELQLLQYLNR